MGAKMVSPMNPYRCWTVTVRLDRTIGVPKIRSHQPVPADGSVEPDHDVRWRLPGLSPYYLMAWRAGSGDVEDGSPGETHPLSTS
jgi:hypothetical protein